VSRFDFKVMVMHSLRCFTIANKSKAFVSFWQ
jgi:hypothetical protein